MKDTNVVPLDKKENLPRIAFTAIPAEIQVNPIDSRNCFAESWVNRTGVKGRCKGISTILDSGDLVCRYFEREAGVFDISTNPTARLFEPDGSVARWGQSKVIRRCNACIVGEQVLKSTPGGSA